jgi:dienelactone hydrolase
LFRRLSPFPFAGLPVVAGDTAFDHFVAPPIARHDEGGEVAAAEAKGAEGQNNENWLRNRLLAVWGPSRGGELALLLGATFTDINAVSAWVPSGVVFWGIGWSDPGDRSSWTFRGKPLPYLQQDNPFAATVPVLERGCPFAYAPVYRSHLGDESAVERSTIPVENICGPVQLVSGGDDQMWPSAELADIAFRRLKAHKHPYPFHHLKFDKAGHQILIPHGPRTRLVWDFEGYLYSQGGTAKDNAEAGVVAWRDLLTFLAGAEAERNCR